MVTVNELVEQEIMRSPYLQDALYQGILNTTALARQLKPQFDKILNKDITHTSIVMALKRCKVKLRGFQKTDFQMSNFISDITLKSSIIVCKVRNTRDIMSPAAKLIHIAHTRNTYLSFVKGWSQTTVIADKELRSDIEKELGNDRERLVFFDNLGAIIIKLTGKHAETPGIFQFLLQQLAWRGVSIYELVYVDDEVVTIVEQSSIDEAFLVLRNATRQN